MLLAAAPALAAQPADVRKQELDKLLQALKSAPSQQVAASIESRLRTVWLHQGSPAAVLLLGRGDRDLQGNLGGEALDDYDAVLTLEPEYPEAFNHRAAARAALGDYAGALADIEQALRREPRFFPALQSLSHLAELQGDWKGALAAWQKVLELDPRIAGGAERLEMLQKKVDGEAA